MNGAPWALTVLCGLGALGLLGCDGKGTQDLPTVGVCINTWPGLGPFYVAHAKGFDKEEGIQLKVIMTEDTQARRSSLISGDVDLVGITLDTVIIARSRGMSMVVVGESDVSFGGDGIIATDEIKSVADLKGKKIACAEGLPSHFFLLSLLRNEGMSPKDITLVPADDGGQAAFLFTSGRVDAAVTWDPWISRAESLTRGHVLITSRDAPNLIVGIVCANEKLLDKRADRIRKALRAWFKAVAYVREHPDEAAAIMAKEYNVPVEDFKRMSKGAKLADLKANREMFGTSKEPGPIHKLAKEASDIWLGVGAIKKPVPPEEVIDWRVIEGL